MFGVNNLLGHQPGYPTDGSNNLVFLKLYDWRFSEQLRRDHGIEPWTEDTQREYINAVRTGAADQFLHNLHPIPKYEDDTCETWDYVQNETFLADKVRQFFDAETAAYDRLGDIQGKLVRRLIASVRLDLLVPNTGGDAAEQCFCVKGILLQYIDGFPLSKAQDDVPRSDWQGIVDQTVTVVQVIGDHNILNRDVRPDNFIIQRKGGGSGGGAYTVFMIDFGLVRFRGSDESDRD
ncbi:hypothetical protein DV735_g985, partial [Chaetothyriales sp. CBS 134920]